MRPTKGGHTARISPSTVATLYSPSVDRCYINNQGRSGIGRAPQESVAAPAAPPAAPPAPASPPGFAASQGYHKQDRCEPTLAVKLSAPIWRDPLRQFPTNRAERQCNHKTKQRGIRISSGLVNPEGEKNQKQGKPGWPTEHPDGDRIGNSNDFRVVNSYFRTEIDHL